MYYRFHLNNTGIYEAVDEYCPRDDIRRESKPDGSWLNKAGKQFPGGLSFWTEAGLKEYIDSGLCNWHLSVLPLNVKVVICKGFDKVLYEDDLQVIVTANAIQNFEELDSIDQLEAYLHA